MPQECPLPHSETCIVLIFLNQMKHCGIDIVGLIVNFYNFMGRLFYRFHRKSEHKPC